MRYRRPLSLPKTWASIELLKPRCRSWLAASGYGHGWFPGRWCGEETLTSPHRDDVTDVVLFGDFFERLMDCDSWPAGDYRLWFLGTAAARAARLTLGVPAHCIGIIPRTDLFPTTKPMRDLPRLNTPWSLVHAGRLSASKSFGLVLRVASALQTTHGHDCELVAFGRPDELGRGARECSPGFPDRVKELARSLPWRTPPRFAGEKAPETWPLSQLRNPVFISLSTYLQEDFGVAAAQARAAGWPCILSDWGGHRDVKGDSVIHLDPATLTDETDPRRVLLVARTIHERLADGEHARQSLERREGNRAQTPRPIAWQALVTRTAAARERWRSGALDESAAAYLRCFGIAPSAWKRRPDRDEDWVRRMLRSQAR